MLIVKCDICKSEIDGGQQQNGPLHFCITCIPYSRDYGEGVAHIFQEEQKLLRRRIENYRVKYHQQIVKGEIRPRLEAVK